MTTFAEAHGGDMIHLRGILVRLLAHDKTWDLPLRLLDEPAPCGGPRCRALVCEALTPDGRLVHLHRLGSREIDVLESANGSELAAHGGDDLAVTASGPSVRGGPKLPLDIEDEFQRGKEDE